MATVSDVKESLQVLSSCSFCLGDFTDPVTTLCGHNFCRSCIMSHWEKYTNFPCPQCKETSTERNLSTNRQLANVIKIVKILQCSKRRHEDDLCEEHGKKLKLFCAEDQRPICVQCDRSQDHQFHDVTPIDEAAEDYRKLFQIHLDLLKKELDDLFKYKCSEQEKDKELKSEREIKRQKITSEFEELHQFLHEEQRVLLAMLEEEEKEMAQRFREHETRLEEQSFSLRQLISEIEEKCRQLDTELLKNAKDTVNRYLEREVRKPEAASSEGKMCYQLSYPRQTIILRKLITKFGETCFEELEWWTKYAQYAVDVTLDPETAHPEIMLSKDRKSMRRGNTRMKLADVPERYTTSVSILGCQGIATGRHYWEVEVGDATEWACGVCKESVSRKGRITFSPENEYWALGLCEGQEYLAFISLGSKLVLRVKPRAVGIFIDYEEGKVLFYDADEKSHLFTFTDTFVGKLRPYFSLGLKTGDQNAGTLKIRPVSDWE